MFVQNSQPQDYIQKYDIVDNVLLLNIFMHVLMEVEKKCSKQK